VIVATAGHVDHGKTTLVRALTGVDTDRLDEERRRGLTIDLGFAYVDDGDERWGFVDVPGHHRFVGNMLAGVAGVDAALLVVAADDGPMPQTREHLDILDLLGVDRALVALTKADLVDADRLAEVRATVSDLLAPTPLAEAPVLPVAAPDGRGLDALRAALRTLGRDRRIRPGSRARFAVDRAFTVRGVGLVVTGCVHAGRIAVGDELVLQPSGASVRVRGLRARDRRAEAGAAGDRLALDLVGVDADAVGRGDWLVAPGLGACVQRFDARVRCLGDARLRSGLEVHVHHGARRTLGRVTLLDGDDARPRVHVSTRDPLPLCLGDRFVLRDAAASTTLGGGTVLDADPPRRGRARPERLAVLDALEADDVDARVRGLLAARPFGLDLEHLARRTNTETETLRAAVPDALVAPGGGCIVRDAAHWTALGDRIVESLERFHAGHPQLAGMGVDELRRVLETRPAPGVLDAALRDLVREGWIARTATRYHRPGHRARLADDDDRRWARIRPRLDDPPVRPPVIHDLAREIDAAPEDVAALLARVHHTGGVLRVADNRYMLPEGILELARAVEAVAAAQDGGRFDVRAYRDATGIGRNLAIDVLEFFDRSGLTRRRGDTRAVVGDAEGLFGSG
jgi:selenocysteine-specific elongation factor